MDTKKIIKTVLFIVFVPTVLVGAWYGGKYVYKKYGEWKVKKGTDPNSTEVKK